MGFHDDLVSREHDYQKELEQRWITDYIEPLDATFGVEGMTFGLCKRCGSIIDMSRAHKHYHHHRP